MAKKIIRRIHDKLTGDIVYAWSASAPQIINWHSRDRFTVTIPSQTELLKLRPEDVRDATADVHPDQQPLEIPAP